MHVPANHKWKAIYIFIKLVLGYFIREEKKTCDKKFHLVVVAAVVFAKLSQDLEKYSHLRQPAAPITAANL